MRSVFSHIWPGAALGGLLILLGCEIETGSPEPQARPPVQVSSRQAAQLGKGAASHQSVKTAARRSDERRPDEKRPAPVGFDFDSPRRGFREIMGGQNEREAFQRIAAEVRDAARIRDTLVVWLFEQSPAAEPLRKSLVDDVAQVAESAAGQDHSIEMGIVGYGNETNLVTQQPVAKPDEVKSAIERLENDDGKAQNIFAALTAAAETFLPYRMSGREVLFVVVGVSRGSDLEAADPVIANLRRAAVSVLGIGPAVPFGWDAKSAYWAASDSGSMRGKMRRSNQTTDALSPAESLYPERIRLTLSGSEDTEDMKDSGYGPFGLELVCRQTGGRFYRIFEAGEEDWELDPHTGLVPPSLLIKYAPDYVSEPRYRELLAENKCRQALHEAAQLPPAEGLGGVRTSFEKQRDEARMARVLSEAQQRAAVRDQPVQRLYDVLSAAQSDRPRLSGPRWQAAYDLAMGQVLAAKARLDGYNAMLAMLKQGKRFANPNSKRWVLEPADEIAASSLLDKMAKNSRVYLKRVVDEHPGTPWAEVARRELDYPAGWKLTEE